MSRDRKKLTIPPSDKQRHNKPQTKMAGLVEHIIVKLIPIRKLWKTEMILDLADNSISEEGGSNTWQRQVVISVKCGANINDKETNKNSRAHK